MKTLKFNFEVEAKNKLDIESISNCCIRAVNDLEYNYFLVIRTINGKTYFAECGPTLNDSDRLPSGFITSLNIFEYNDKKVLAKINAFLNDNKKEIIDAEVIELKDALNNFKNLKNFMEGLRDDKKSD